MSTVPPEMAFAQKPVIPGGFCSRSGRVGTAASGRSYICSSTTTDRRKRWRLIRSRGGSIPTPGTIAENSSGSASSVPVAPKEVEFRFDESQRRWAFLDGDGSNFCAIDLTGQTTCSGNESYGSLGDGGSANYCGVYDECLRTALVKQPEPFRMVSVHNYAVCALGHSKRIYCWGSNTYGQLGNGSVKAQSTPTPISSDQTFDKVSLGTYGACGLSVSGDVLCWGRNLMGLIGNAKSRGLFDVGITPTRVAASSRFIDVTVGGDFACAVSDDSSLWCWGAASGTNQPDRLATSTPFITRQVSNPTAISAGQYSTCILEDSVITCWGILPNIVQSHNRTGVIGIREGWNFGCSWTRTDIVCGVTNHRWGNDSFYRNHSGVSPRLPVSSAIQTIIGGPSFDIEELGGTRLVCALADDGRIACYEWEVGRDEKGGGSIINKLVLVSDFR